MWFCVAPVSLPPSGLRAGDAGGRVGVRRRWGSWMPGGSFPDARWGLALPWVPPMWGGRRGWPLRAEEHRERHEALAGAGGGAPDRLRPQLWAHSGHEGIPPKKDGLPPRPALTPRGRKSGPGPVQLCELEERAPPRPGVRVRGEIRGSSQSHPWLEAPWPHPQTHSPELPPWDQGPRQWGASPTPGREMKALQPLKARRPRWAERWAPPPPGFQQH